VKSHYFVTVLSLITLQSWAAQPGGVGGGVNVPPLLGPGGYRGLSNENDLCFYSRQSFSTVGLQVTEFQLP